MEEMKVFDGKKFKQALDQQGLSVNAFHKLSGIRRSSIADYIDGKVVPGANRAAKIAYHLNCPLEYLFAQKLVRKQTKAN